MRFLTPFALGIASTAAYADHALEGSVGVELRSFTQENTVHSSALINPEWLWVTEDGDHRFFLQAFARVEIGDDERTHFDLTEALWTYIPNHWEFAVGIGKVFWGVTESNHLVDIINQTDMAESADGEAKLGQPMLKASAALDWGTLDFYVLPYFRERRFSGGESPLALPINNDTPVIYESEQEQNHRDIAIRYSHYIGDWDLSLSYFNGTNRAPQIIVNPDFSLNLFYDQLTQLGAAVQATMDRWLWKLEAVAREDSQYDYGALSAGFEYTFFGITNSAADLGLLMEYNRDTRGSLSGNALQKDIFTGARLTLNNVQDTNFLIGLSQDLDNSDSRLMFIEANRRLGDSFRLTLDARVFSSETESDPLYMLERGDYISVELEYFY